MPETIGGVQMTPQQSYDQTTADLLRENAELKRRLEATPHDDDCGAIVASWQQRAEAAEKALADAQSRLAHTQAGLTIWMERSKANAAEYNEAYDAMCDIAQMLDCAEDWAAIKAALKETLGKVGELRAAVADAPHDIWCAVTFPAAPAELMPCNCWKSETQ